MFKFREIFKRKQPCWILQECEPEYRNTCPAFLENRGFECWNVENTPCKGVVSSNSKKLQMCSSCDYYILNLWGFQPTASHKKLIQRSIKEAMERMAKVSVVQVVEEIVDLMRYLAEEKNVTLVFKTEESTPHIFGDIDHLKQVSITLLSNAINHAKLNGEVVVSVTDFDNKGVEVIVSDNGESLSEKERDLLFDSLTETGEKKKHSVGLAITREIINQHGGRIWVESGPGEMTSIIFTLPNDQRRSERRIKDDRRKEDRRSAIEDIDYYEKMQETFEKEGLKQRRETRRRSERRGNDRRTNI